MIPWRPNRLSRQHLLIVKKEDPLLKISRPSDCLKRFKFFED